MTRQSEEAEATHTGLAGYSLSIWVPTLGKGSFWLKAQFIVLLLLFVF